MKWDAKKGDMGCFHTSLRDWGQVPLFKRSILSRFRVPLNSVSPMPVVTLAPCRIALLQRHLTVAVTAVVLGF